MDCIACGGSEFRLWKKKGIYEVMRCRSCGLGVTSPRLPTGELAGMNRAEYVPEARAAIYEAHRPELTERYLGWIAEIKKIVHSGSLLDVGCNIGAFMNSAREAGFAAVGVEMNEACAAYGRNEFGLDIRSAEFSRSVFPEGRFDVVTMLDVLEHSPEPGAMLREAARVLRPGGVLAVQCPNIASLMAALMGEDWNWLTPPDHLYHFTPEALRRLLVASGFRLASLRTREPAGDFSGNIYSGFRAGGLASRLARKLLWLSSLALVPALQRLWWAAGRGGLIEVLAVKEK